MTPKPVTPGWPPMPERSSARGTAHDRLQRILYLLPAAGGKDGSSIEELCDALGVTPEVLLSDITEVTAREYYLPAGSGDSLRITVDSERVRVWTSGEFRRPPKLTAREALALGLGLRALASEREGADREGLLGLARRLEAGLASVPQVEFAPDFAIAEAAGTGGPDGGMRGILIEAARERRACAFGYLKPGAAEPERRRLEPYVLVASTGRWYAVGRDPDREDIRVFRLDRMLDLWVLDDRFERDHGFDLERYLTGAYVHRAPGGAGEGEPPSKGGDAARPGAGSTPVGDGSTARIRYSPAIARWILEREEGQTLADGAAVVEHVVSDPGWASRHILRYGGDAEVLGPADLRARVAGGARKAEAAHR